MSMLLRILLLFVVLGWVAGAFGAKPNAKPTEPYSAEDGSGPPPWPRP